MIKATQKLHEMGQSRWLDNITRMIFACAAASHRNFECSFWRAVASEEQSPYAAAPYADPVR